MESIWKRAAVSCVGAFIFLVAFPLAGFAQHGGGCYDASLGTLPEAQGWTYADDIGGNPLPYVSGGLLHETSANGGQYWYLVDSLDFSQHVTLEASLRVNSSNYVPNVGTGTREGYYFFLADLTHQLAYSIGLADAGFNLNAVQVPNQPLTPFAIADGNFHTYRFDIINNMASFFIDNIQVATNLPPFFNGGGNTDDPIFFGGAAGASRSDTDLTYLCHTTTPNSLVVSIDIKPGTLLNPINTKSEGKIPVAILSTQTFDATTRVNTTSLTFGKTGSEHSLAFCNSGGEDINGDGLLDLVCHFNTPLTGFQVGVTSGILKGTTIDSVAIQGTDSVRIR